MHKGLKSCVSYNGEQSSFFSSFRGIRKDENLPPVLFALVLNDLESFLCDKGCNGVNFEFQYDDITLYFKLLVLRYADDTVVFCTDEKEFQNNLDMFYEYSELWYLPINFDKTKIMIFGTRQDQRFNSNLGGHKIDICTDFRYLGVICSRNRHFHQTKKRDVEQARKAMHVLFKRVRNLDIPIDLQLYLFDHAILSIALYGCEIWGFENIQSIENLHNDYIRQINNLRKSTPIYIYIYIYIYICYMQNWDGIQYKVI